ncbi:MAG: exodeoxyribonuclease VII large subunit [Clostridia bacterium]|nr:exodeoxyribonuclease VII large subunit [Clostridia bacterium]
MDPYEKVIVTVSQLNGYTKTLLEQNELLSDIFVKGEISNFKIYSSGHLYFSLKDEKAAIAGVMWRSYAGRLPFVPKDGLKVIAHGRISLYEDTGRYQIIADDLQPDGIGSLYYAYEQLKRKLSEEGLFDERYKKPLPRFPRRVGIITSPTGAAIRDMTRILGRRFPMVEMLLYPTLVQGNGAAAQLSAGIRYFNEKKNVDVIIIGRGGGSIEDLWEFNNEDLARTVFASEIPVISAVGHESDFTICDFVADVRASTPSAAAELAVPEQTEIVARLDNAKKRLALLASAYITDRKKRLEVLAASPFLRSPLNFIDTKRLNVTQLLDRLDGAVRRNIDKKTASYKEKVASLTALSPLAVLSRGYGVSYGEDGNILKSVKNIKKGDSIRSALSDGELFATVTDIKINGEDK